MHRKSPSSDISSCGYFKALRTISKGMCTSMYVKRSRLELNMTWTIWKQNSTITCYKFGHYRGIIDVNNAFITADVFQINFVHFSISLCCLVRFELPPACIATLSHFRIVIFLSYFTALLQASLVSYVSSYIQWLVFKLVSIYWFT